MGAQPSFLHIRPPSKIISLQIWATSNLFFFQINFIFFLIFQKYLSFEPIDQFSSVVPFWKPHNVSFLLRRGAGPPAPPYCRPWLEGYNFRTFFARNFIKILVFLENCLILGFFAVFGPHRSHPKIFFFEIFYLETKNSSRSLKLLLFWGQFGPQKKVFQKTWVLTHFHSLFIK